MVGAGEAVAARVRPVRARMAAALARRVVGEGAVVRGEVVGGMVVLKGRTVVVGSGLRGDLVIAHRGPGIAGDSYGPTCGKVRGEMGTRTGT